MFNELLNPLTFLLKLNTIDMYQSMNKVDKMTETFAFSIVTIFRSVYEMDVYLRQMSVYFHISWVRNTESA